MHYDEAEEGEQDQGGSLLEKSDTAKEKQGRLRW